MTKEMKKIIDQETEQEIKRALKDVPYSERTATKHQNESDLQKMKA